jgi:DNA polymerase-3 subunit gamma/tau
MLEPASWPSLVRTLALSGFSRQLAEQSELASVDGSRINLRIPPSARPLAGYRDRLATSIEQQWGFRCTIDIQVVDAIARTVASENAERRSSAIAQAQETLDKDPFVNELVRGFGATIESVAPDQPTEPQSDAED